MKHQFRKIRLSKSNKERLEVINSIIEDYQSQGYVLTLRQLYYQLVSRDVIPNKAAEYSKLSTLLKEGRMGGVVDWNAIEDRVRKPSRPYWVHWVADALRDTVNQYMLDRMDDQDVYIEVWVEKDALSGVLKRVTNKYGINIMVNRWYSSASAMFDSFERFKDAYNNDKSIVILYLGDYDPSGMDMIRDIRDRIKEFYEWYKNLEDASHSEYDDYSDMDFTVTPIALTREQITKYNPPPNPAKRTDPRSKWFIDEHGTSSWEVDALKPEILNTILTDAIIDLIDIEKFQKKLDQEKVDKARITSIIS